MKFLRVISLCLVFVLSTACKQNAENYSILEETITETKEVKQPNVLLLYIDDLRTELGSYGSKKVKTPHIDALALESTQFNEAYCNVSVCGASRASMLTGIRPTKTQFLNYNTFVEKEQPNAISMPKLFKQNGYKVISNGKIYHHLDDNDTDFDEVYRPYAFDKNKEGLAPTDYWQSLWKDYQNIENIKEYKATNTGPAFEMANVPDSVYIDGIMTQKVIRDIKKLKDSKEPFFLTAGFISPHLPFNAPKKYWDLYPKDAIKQPYNNYAPKNVPKFSVSKWPEMRAYSGIPKNGQVSDETAKKLIHGYYATVSYVDALIGNIIAELKAQELYDNTVIILVSDHGYNLQEHTQWAKFTTHRISSRVPLLISAPKFRHTKVSNALVELVDVYPTITELCGIENPKNQLEGQSLVKHIKDGLTVSKKAIFLKNGNGFGIKTTQFGYTEFINPKTNKLIATTLYDHDVDPDENINVANQPEYKMVVEELHNILHTQFNSNLN